MISAGLRQPAPATRRRVTTWLGAALTLATIAGTPTAAQAATSSTTVKAAGHSYSASLAAGTTVSLSVGSYSVTCSVSTSTGSVPAAPGNTSASGAVTSTVSAPTFSSCDTGTPLFSATISTNSTSGSWGHTWQYDPAGATTTLTIPKGGVVVKTSGFVSCTVTVAPNGAATVGGTWINGSNGSASTESLASSTVPVTVSGLFCPTETTSNFSATYAITDTTDSTQSVEVTA